jgi:mono/diheme cytochrome c family protein
MTTLTDATKESTASRTRRKNWIGLVIGFVIGGALAMCGVVFVGMPLALGHRNDLPLEKLYGNLAVGIVVRTQAGSAQNPVAQNPRALEAGRAAYTGACSVCHGANGDGNGAFGQAIYPPATDLRAHDTQEKTDAQLFWIIKNGLSFAGMPGFGNQFSDQDIWNLVTYTRSLASPNAARPVAAVPTPTAEQLAMANPNGDATQRGAAVYFASGCNLCHGAVGDAPGELGLRGGGREAQEAVRRGRRGMPAYDQTQISDAQLADLVAYMNTFRGVR